MIGVALLMLAGAALPDGPADTLPPPASPTITVIAPSGITARQRLVPPQLTEAERTAYRQIFRDLEAGRLAQAEAGITALPGGLLTETARAALIVARGASRGGNLPSRSALVAWLAANVDLPLSGKVARLAAALPGADSAPLPLLPEVRAVRPASAPGYTLAPGPADEDVASRLQPLLAADRNDEAERIWLAEAPRLSGFARADLAARIAWNHYRMGDDPAAWRMGLEASAGPGDGAARGAWTAGLAAWRLGRWRDAAQAFDQARRDAGAERRAAAAFWAARAWGQVGDSETRGQRLAEAATAAGTFYGVLARRVLGVDQGLDWREPDFITADWNYLKDMAGARRAAALAEIGQIGLADRELRHLAATAPADAFPAILRLATRLDLPATQYSLAVRPPLGLEAPLSARYPAPDWTPWRGWRVPRALAFAHALQESAFATNATSRVGAKGLMQLMPDTRALVAARLAREHPEALQGPLGNGDLADPAYSFELGQTYLELLARMEVTGGLLPKVIAAYNAGPGAVQTWNRTLDDQGDPLLFIESIPWRETRHYVGIVLRNSWIYGFRDGEQPASLEALAQGLWPRLPGIGGPAMVKRAPAAVRPRPEPGSLRPDYGIDDDRVVAGGQ